MLLVYDNKGDAVSGFTEALRLTDGVIAWITLTGIVAELAPSALSMTTPDIRDRVVRHDE